MTFPGQPSYRRMRHHSGRPYLINSRLSEWIDLVLVMLLAIYRGAAKLRVNEKGSEQ